MSFQAVRVAVVMGALGANAVLGVLVACEVVGRAWVPLRVILLVIAAVGAIGAYRDARRGRR